MPKEPVKAKITNRFGIKYDKYAACIFQFRRIRVILILFSDLNIDNRYWHIVAYSKHIETWLGAFCLVSRLGFLSLFTLVLIASMAYLSVQHLR